MAATVPEDVIIENNANQNINENENTNKTE